MKRGILILPLLLLSLVAASPTLEFQNEQIQATETIFATITTSGEFTKQIESSDIKFFKGRKQLSLEHDIIYYEGTHYLYIYTTSLGNLTLQIENILYKENETLKSTTITEQLNITEKTNQSLTIKPGFIFTSTSAIIKLINPTNLQLNLTYNDNETSIDPFQSFEVELTPTQTFSHLNISTYKDFSIPIIYFNTTGNITFVSPETKPNLRAEFELILLELFTNNKTQQTIKLFNFGDDNLTNLEATSNSTFIKIEKLRDMSGRETQNLTLEINSELSGYFQEIINISYIQNETEKTTEVTLVIFVLPEGISEPNFQIQEETCEQLSGQICEPGVICNGTITFSKNKESCCLASCIEIKDDDSGDSNGFGWLIAIVIFAILGFIGHYFYKKQKSLQTPTPRQAMKTPTEKFEKRLVGNENKRTTGNLTKS